MATLYIVATPIGNLGDITLRAIDTLKSVDLILAEDTRHSRKLLTHYDIKKPLLSYHEHNEEQRTPKIIEKLQSGLNIALISDAGTPGISDPAYRLVRACAQAGLDVTSIPGPSSVVAAVVQSGLPTDRFVFEGFLPRKKGRKSRLKMLSQEERTIVIFESPERTLKTLKDCFQLMGNRPLSVCRELTKLHEEVYRGDTHGAVDYFSRRKPKGEIVIVIGKDDPNVYFD
ncbi:MAG: 16S rRNA (cytidine(1402)-2'-O)-methyltransferase [Candidatus Marinimicrobia bacterium]|nr:16S rRNA (cytidine(1402)-2'-O)-methyltransferase [Candidatus Neomarinimicrobiota bacterium]MDP6456499.1 16S rRNA (cytidine(1402)-2'-O)-methyltransferase [Candidatus Neomarinimicrobiota bacterium]MDP6593719.1 16S rRNA (cytidine(1402)-2'-O)-methyltransferase [Candidatus Neomarinimicrobiota bacterium]MDP6966211.1 16S rRNA (cytidine(1402)-2'-O)-methyltransferase [Candidatus Neomarinimicrobiota bacterium]